MEFHKITNLLDNEVALNASNRLSKFRAKNWVEINDESRGVYMLIVKLNLRQQY